MENRIGDIHESLKSFWILEKITKSMQPKSVVSE